MTDSKKYVRIEYEIPPMRSIMSTWFEDEPEMLDDEIREEFGRQFPRAKIRKFERGIEARMEEER